MYNIIHIINNFLKIKHNINILFLCNFNIYNIYFINNSFISLKGVYNDIEIKDINKHYIKDKYNYKKFIFNIELINIKKLLNDKKDIYFPIFFLYGPILYQNFNLFEIIKNFNNLSHNNMIKSCNIVHYKNYFEYCLRKIKIEIYNLINYKFLFNLNQDNIYIKRKILIIWINIIIYLFSITNFNDKINYDNLLNILKNDILIKKHNIPINDINNIYNNEIINIEIINYNLFLIKNFINNNIYLNIHFFDIF